MILKSYKMGNKYKFYATIFSVKKLIILYAICLPIIITVAFYLYFNTNFDLVLLFLICFILCFLFHIASCRYVKIILYDNSIAIYYWNRLKYSAPISDLKYIQGIDIEKTDQRSDVKLVFSNKKFYFSIWGIQGAKITNDAKLIKMLVDKYQLQKIFYRKKFFFIDIYQYINPQYKINL